MGTEVASKLQSSKFGIICLTPSNIHADWILFEAGALSKTLENTRTCTLLIGIDHADIEFPLAQFQHTQTSKSEIFKLASTINKHLDAGSLTDEHLKIAFEKWWPELEAPLASLPSEGTEPSTRRTDRQLLEEMLELLRSENRSTAATSRIRSNRQRREVTKCPACSLVQFASEEHCRRCGAPIEVNKSVVGAMSDMALVINAIVSATLQHGRFGQCSCDPCPDGSFLVTATDKAGKKFTISVPPDAQFDFLHDSVRSAFDEAVAIGQ